MTDHPGWYQWEGKDLLLCNHVMPKSCRDEIIGPQDIALKVRITATPKDGRANAHLIKFLAKTYGVARHRIDLLSGKTGRTRRLRRI